MEALKNSDQSASEDSLELVEGERANESSEIEQCESMSELFYNYLSLISPGFIESMTTFSGGGKKDPLVDILCNYLEIEEEVTEKSSRKGENRGSTASSSNSRGRAKILPFTASEQIKDKIDECESTSAFIYNEKKKAEKVNRQVKGKEIIELYQKSSQVNVKQERALRKDLSKSHKVGVLINKRQY